MSTNIEGLSSLIDRLNRKIQLLDDKINSLQVRGGHNILVNKFGNEFVIDSVGEDGGAAPAAVRIPPWTLRSKPVENFDPDNPRYTFTTYGGMLNNLLPDNYEDIVEVSEDDEGYIYWEAKCTYHGVTNLTCKFQRGLKPPDTQTKFEEEALPSVVKGLVGYINGNGIMYQFAKEHIKMMPDIVYTISDEDNIALNKNYYTWMINEV